MIKMNEEELRKDILFNIEMQLYDEFNDIIATMNDHLGEIYGYSDVENVKQAEKNRKIELMEKAIKQLQNNWNELKKWLQANDIHYAEAIPFKETLRKMQELEQGKDD